QVLESELSSFEKTLLMLAGEDADPEMVAMLTGPTARIASELTLVREGSERIRALVNDMRNFSRLDEAAWKEVDLLEGLRATISLVHSQFPGIDIELAASTPLVRFCNPAELNQIYLNFIRNGYQAIMERRRVEPKAPGRVSIEAGLEGDEVCLRFHDTGCGIAEKDRDHIFEAFYTTRPPGSGTGLGLYSSFRIAEQHGGRIDFSSVPGEGSCFTLVLPLESEENHQTLFTAPVLPKTSSNREDSDANV
ncbi:MAG: HAMP domain-containing histidine kinase, partial [Pseudomonadales bacterium]|nr:HAMP domain-containing histidine kinase [Pseudomonadales bacterium]